MALFAKSVILLLVCLFTFSVSASGREDTADPMKTQTICAYPLSGQYEFLQRLLYYVLVVFAIFTQGHLWLSAGALATIMTYSGAAAVHAIILADISRNSLLDVDTFGVWSVVSVGALAVEPVLTFSHILRWSPARPIVGFWGTLVAVGSICASVTFWRNFPAVEGCMSPEGGLITGTLRNLDKQGSNCSYVCDPSRQMLRDPAEIVILPEALAFGSRFNLIWASGIITLICGALVGVLGCCIGSNSQKNEAQLTKAISKQEKKVNSRAAFVHYLDKNRKSRPRDQVNARRSLASATKDLRRLRAELETGEPQLNPSVFAYVSPCVFPIVVILNEIYLLSGGSLPSSERYYAVGQWAPWVSTVLVVIAAVIVHRYQPGLEAEQAQIKKGYELRQIKKKIQGIPQSQQTAVLRGDTPETRDSVSDLPASSESQVGSNAQDIDQFRDAEREPSQEDPTDTTQEQENQHLFSSFRPPSPDLTSSFGPRSRTFP